MSYTQDEDDHKTKNTLKPEPDEKPADLRFPPEEEAVRDADQRDGVRLTDHGQDVIVASKRNQSFCK